MKSLRTVSAGVALALLALVLAPSLVTAQNAVLYEVTENMKLKRNDGGGQRVATAALMGWAVPGTSVCPDWLVQQLGKPGCAITALASNSINLRTGTGSVSGTFKVVIQGDNPIDGPELVVLNGELRGTMDLSPALRKIAPLGILWGTWNAKGDASGPLAGLRTGGTLSGTFRLPFVVGIPEGCLDRTPIDCVYVSKPSYLVDGAPVEIEPLEYSLGVPAVKLEITFVEKMRGLKHDAD